MTKIISDLLNPNELLQIRSYIEQANFVDGRISAGIDAAKVKHNLQLDFIEHRAFIDQLAQKIISHPFIQSWTKPKRITPLLVNCYLPGMEYGVHVDNPLIGNVRTDFSFTLFLSEPNSYEGGYLQFVEEQNHGIKLAAGSLVIYKTGRLHCVTPVITGQRLVAVGWIQSLIQDSKLRETLFDLEQVRNVLNEQPGFENLSNILSKCIFDLIRSNL